MDRSRSLLAVTGLGGGVRCVCFSSSVEERVMMVASVTSSRGMGLATAARERERGDWPFILSDAEVNLMRLEFLFL